MTNKPGPHATDRPPVAENDEAPPPALDETIAGNLRRLRTMKSWSQRQLAQAMSEIHGSTGRWSRPTDKHPEPRPIPAFDQSKIALMESGERSVSAPDLLIAAAALDVTPQALVVSDETGNLYLGPGLTIDGESALLWFSGIAPYAKDQASDEARVRVSTPTLKIVQSDDQRDLDRERWFTMAGTLLMLAMDRVPGISDLRIVSTAYAITAAHQSAMQPRRKLSFEETVDQIGDLAQGATMEAGSFISLVMAVGNQIRRLGLDPRGGVELTLSEILDRCMSVFDQSQHALRAIQGDLRQALADALENPDVKLSQQTTEMIEGVLREAKVDDGVD